jgi:hypothetical protein
MPLSGGGLPHGYGGYASGGRHSGPGSYIPQGSGGGGLNALGYSSAGGAGGPEAEDRTLSYFQSLPQGIDPFDLQPASYGGSGGATSAVSTAAPPSLYPGATMATATATTAGVGGLGEWQRGEAAEYLGGSAAPLKRRSFATETSTGVDYLPPAATSSSASTLTAADSRSSDRYSGGSGSGGSGGSGGSASGIDAMGGARARGLSSKSGSFGPYSAGSFSGYEGGGGRIGAGASGVPGGGYRSASTGHDFQGSGAPYGSGHPAYRSSSAGFSTTPAAGGPSGGLSDAEVEGLARKAIDRGLADGDDSALTWQDFDVLFRPILNHFSLYKHGRSGPAKRHNFWCNSALTRLYWDTTKFLDVLKTGERHIELSDVISLVDGVGTDNLRKRLARGEILSSRSDRCFSLVTTSRTFDLEAMSVAQKKVLVRAFNFLLKRLQMRAGAGTSSFGGSSR